MRELPIVGIHLVIATMTIRREWWEEDASLEEREAIQDDNPNKTGGSTIDSTVKETHLHPHYHLQQFLLLPRKRPKLPFPFHKHPLLQGCRSVHDTYERISRVSEGAYGIVRKAKNVTTNEIVALKQIKFDTDDDDDFEEDNSAPKMGFPVNAL
jgi:serine/threonine protein kinase